MKHRAAAVLAFACLLAAQTSDPKFDAIKAKHDRGEQLTRDEEYYAAAVIEHRNQEAAALKNADYAKAHPPRESTGLVPLTDLGKGLYKGEPGGLYPGGENTPPAAHLQAGLRLAAEIVPRDADGNTSPAGRIAFLTIGMSNTQQESRAFVVQGEADTQLDPHVTLVNGAQGAQTARLIANPAVPYWKLVDARLREAGVTAEQVQAAWLKEADGGPKEPFPIEVKKLEDEHVAILHILHDKFPHLKIVYLSSRIYAGYAGTPLNPEPHAYEGGFAVKWLIAGQIAGHPELNYDSAKGPVRSPWLAWGPYLWTDGLMGRQDGLVWRRDEVGPDGTHPSPLGCRHVARLLLGFLKTSPTSRPWFVIK